MKNLLSSWFKRSSRESLQDELPLGGQAPMADSGSYRKEESMPEFLGRDPNAFPMDLVQERGKDYGGGSEGEFPRKKMDENLYRALSG